MEVTNDLMKKYEKLAHFVSQKYTKYDDYDDIVQEARVGIWHGLESYDESFGGSLLSYLFGCAKREVGKYFNAKYATKKQEYQNYYHEEKGTFSTLSLDQYKETMDGKVASIGDLFGEEDENISRICIEDAVQKSLDKMFNVDYKYTHNKTKDFYVDYLKLTRDVGSDHIIPILQKKYTYTRQRAHEIIDKYNKRMKELLASCI